MDQPRKKPGVLARISRTFTGHSGGASWSEVHIAGGDADFALEPAPSEAGIDRAHGARTGEGEAERGLLPGQDHDDGHPERFAPTLTPDAFVHRGVAALDVPSLPVESDGLVTSRRPLSEILYRPRSGTKRDIQLTCSAEPSERDFIDLAAKAAKRSRSAFLMDAALTFAHAYLGDQRPDGVPALPSPQALQDLTRLCGQLLREIHRVGVNLNQIARAINMGTWPDTTDDVLAEVHALARAARLALEHVISGCRGCRHGA
ncbi:MULTISPECIES: plasmid mobilization relaxosome protein MobC [unclassified Streptomyces]|uniref:plasmid mobilization relaxosome protein MobC n=1 Tax=unclassified Streptomyces TaxID=2593676 RepID=UPI002E2D7C85|nr:plasmid mobilization relaxosome protein MobC [Streptomyces sp. NBC_00223]